ncbi:unnamed protein product [Haemonchus placei]|uniref:SWIB domain-containing protein n=1 Tax=Haemonchus placei TaxID=6290 RepID=A0A158QPX8_HAEPC|nr:unnamed protein product [Haemonchus placei]
MSARPIIADVPPVDVQNPAKEKKSKQMWDRDRASTSTNGTGPGAHGKNSPSDLKIETPYYSQEGFTHSYYDCLSNGIVDMERITKYMHDLHIKGIFNQASYEEFVTSEAAMNARQFCYDGLQRMPMVSFGDLVYARTLDHFAGRIRADILSAQIANCKNTNKRGGEIVERTRPPALKLDISIRNCTQHWILEDDHPFVKVDLLDLVLHWHEKRGTTPFQKITDLYRKILSTSTSPPQEIQKYSESLKNLPQKIEETLLGFGEDLLGLAHKELMAAPGASVWSSSFYKQLGQSDEERSKQYERLCEEKIRWRSELFRALQRALRDLRGYEFTVNDDGSNFTWIPNNRKSKRPTCDGSIIGVKRPTIDNSTDDSFELM